MDEENTIEIDRVCDCWLDVGTCKCAIDNS